jgi:hypothetical protein
VTEVLVGLIVAAATIGGILLTQRFERQRTDAARAAQEAADRRKDERQLRDAKRERVRSAYTELLVTARFVLQRAKAMGWLYSLAGMTQKVEQEVEQEFAALERSLASLLLESDAKGIVEIFEQTRKTFGEYMAVLARGIEAARQAGDKPATALLGALTELERRVPELEEMARRHLSSLEQPI